MSKWPFGNMFVIAIWWIWRFRNNHTLGDKHWKIRYVFHFIDIICTNLTSINIHSSKHHINYHIVKWTPPQDGCVKLNIDGSYDSSRDIDYDSLHRDNNVDQMTDLSFNEGARRCTFSRTIWCLSWFDVGHQQFYSIGYLWCKFFRNSSTSESLTHACICFFVDDVEKCLKINVEAPEKLWCNWIDRGAVWWSVLEVLHWKKLWHNCQMLWCNFGSGSALYYIDVRFSWIWVL